jgi:primosomal protein N' (replication factor Y)
MRQVQVLVDCIGIDRLLTYRVPDELAIKIGDILTVPLGERYVGAIAINFDDSFDNLGMKNK